MGVAGAPVGSMVLTKFRETMFLRFFYFLACIQFVTVGLLKVKNNVLAWTAISSFLAMVSLALAVHYVVALRHKKSPPPSELTSARAPSMQRISEINVVTDLERSVATE